MAGNIVKWWRHKILGGYKQFSVLPECPTDTEELIYPNRAPSSCSAPPDLLPTNDREPMIISRTIVGGSGGVGGGGGHGHHHLVQQNDDCSKKKINEIQKEKKSNKSQDPDRVHLEEFTCDVSVEGGKTPQPLQFSFTLYDLDGHGKITKDDIAGIVSTIYESIGKSVVVPHYGSKTINVRLTVSPDAKKLKSSHKKSTVITPRRRLRPRKLTTDDDDCSDTSNDSQRRRLQPTTTTTKSTMKTTGTTSNIHHTKQSSLTASKLITSSGTTNCHQHQNEQVKIKGINQRVSKDSSTTTTTDSATEHFTNKLTGAGTTGLITNSTTSNHNNNNVTFLDNKLIINKSCNEDNLYESIHNLKYCPKDNNLHVIFGGVGINLSETMTQQQNHSVQNKMTSTTAAGGTTKNCCPIVVDTTKVINDLCTLQIKENLIDCPETICRDCTSLEQCTIDVHHKNGRKKLVRKSRSKKLKSQDDKPISRVRSLSVGNENCWNRVEDGATEEECWKSSLRRHDLIEIIRESMEKNRLCFQANRKPTESPSRHRHRSHTISKMIDDYHITNLNEHNQLMPETNLCGYDSFLHAKICNNNLHFTSSPGNLPITPQRNFHHGKSNKNRTKTTTDVTRGNVYSRLQPSSNVKLNTSLLNHLNPNLSAEQKLSRTMNHVEKWLTDRDHKTTKNDINDVNEKQTVKIGGRTRLKLQRSKSKEEIPIKDKYNKIDNNLLKTDLLLDKLNLTSDIVVDNTPKKIFNKEILFGTNTVPQISLSSPVKKSPKSSHHQSKSTPDHLKTKGFIMEYASIPVNADAGECENLLRNGCGGSDEEIGNASGGTPSTVHRYVHEHIHHHYHHFENDEALI